MENKKTTELLDLINKVEKKDEPTEEEYEELDIAIAELRKRTPFRQILGTDDELIYDEESLYTGQQEIREDIKLLKRHKHDDKNGDVLIRI